MPKLNQLIAIEKGVKSETTRQVTDLHRNSQKAELHGGLSRSYEPKDDEGFRYPGEVKRVQMTAQDSLLGLSEALTRLFDVTLSKDAANAEAKADIVVNGSPLLRDVPVTYLLFLEKQLTDIRTFIAKLPALDPAETWTWNDEQGYWSSGEARTAKSKKIPRAFIKAEATDRHPAQVEVFHEDVPEGTWTTVKFSGALSARRRAELLERVTALQHAVKFAREAANGTEAPMRSAAAQVFGYLLAE